MVNRELARPVNLRPRAVSPSTILLILQLGLLAATFLFGVSGGGDRACLAKSVVLSAAFGIEQMKGMQPRISMFAAEGDDLSSPGLFLRGSAAQCSLVKDESVYDKLAVLNASNYAAFAGLLDWRCDCLLSKCTDDGVLVMIANHVGWFGHFNVGDDVMPALFASTFARSLASEFPHLDVSVDARECASTIGRPSKIANVRKPLNPHLSLPKSFWVLGGGSVFEYVGQMEEISKAMKPSYARREPLYLFGTGIQTVTHTSMSSSILFSSMRSAFANASEDSFPSPWAGLLWGGMRGLLSRDIADEALAGTGVSVPYIGDPGFFANELGSLYPPLSPAAEAALGLPAKYILTTCDLITVPSLLNLLKSFVRDGYDVVALSIGNFTSRANVITDTFRLLNNELGSNVSSSGEKVLRTLLLPHMRTFPELLRVFRGASLGLHCMLHGGIIQASTGTPVLAHYGAFKHQDAWLASGLTGGNVVHHVWDRQLAQEIVWKAKSALANSDRVKERTKAFTTTVRQRHDVEMRAFVRHLTSVRYSDVGAALACAPAASRVIVRSHMWYEGAMLEVLLQAV